MTKLIPGKTSKLGFNSGNEMFVFERKAIFLHIIYFIKARIKAVLVYI